MKRRIFSTLSSSVASSPKSLAQALLSKNPVTHSDFSLLRRESISEHACVASLYRHKATGAELLSVTCSPETDTEKVFGVVLKTPVSESTGVAHVLEHSVLCGSKNYPSKEPFVELLKSSLQTFLNAMTYPDRTVYPVASPNETDFRNLVRVYIDAVFHPKIDKWTLLQEGWHLEVDDAGSLSYKGVVLNEMKGVYSNPDTIHSICSDSALYSSHHTYARSSGGDPLDIPSLTYEKFTAFHATHYHPSNARFWFFGDDNEENRLEMVSEALKNFTVSHSAPKQSVIPLQGVIPSPIRISEPYPVGVAGESGGDEDGFVEGSEGGGGTGDSVMGAAVDADLGPSGGIIDLDTASGSLMKAEHELETVRSKQALEPFTPEGLADEHYLTVSWLLHYQDLEKGVTSSSKSSDESYLTTTVQQSTDSFGQSRVEVDAVTQLGLSVLTHLLMGTQTATLYKTLTDSALGSSVIGGGLDDSLVQPVFSVGLKGVKAKNVHLIEPLITHSLVLAAGQGFTEEHIRASMNSMEFALREFATGGSPKGLSLFLGVVQGWIYGRDPISELRYEEALNGLKKRIATDPNFFQGLVRSLLLQNTHKAVVHSFPDPSFAARREVKEKAKLAEIKRTLSDSELAVVKSNAETLLTRQATPDTAEALASIPSLKLSDLPLVSAVISKVKTTLPLTLTSTSSKSTPLKAAASVPSPILLRHEQVTSGIGYGRIALDLSHVPERLLPLLPLLSWCVTSTGTSARDEVAFSRAVGTHTGGIGASVNTSPVPGRQDLVIPLFTMSGKCLSHSSDEMGKLMLEALTTCRLDRKDRILHYLRDSISSHSSSIVSSGHRYAGSFLGAERSKGGWLRELWSGITAFHGAKTLNQSIMNDPAFFNLLHSDLEELRSFVLAAPLRGNALVSSTGDAETLKYVEGALSHVISGLVDAGRNRSSNLTSKENPQVRFGKGWTAGDDKNLYSSSFYLEIGGVKLPSTPRTVLSNLSNSSSVSDASNYSSLSGIHDMSRPIALVVPTQVNYCVRAATLPTNKARIATIPTGKPGVFSSSIPDDSSVTTSFSLSGADDVVSSLLRTGYLWEKVRVQGGAYGGFCSISDTSSSLSFASYRDPHLDETLKIFDKSAAYLADNASSPAFAEDLRKGIISSIGGIDAPMSPSERGATSTGRYISGVTDEMLQTRRKETLSTSTSDAVDLSNRITEAWSAKEETSTVRTCVVSSEAAIAASERKDWVVFKPLQAASK
jgi:Zn-dependent M16 (insulinase) family peptidase